MKSRKEKRFRTCALSKLAERVRNLYAYQAFILYHFQNSPMIRKLKSGEYRLYSRKKNPKTNKRRNLGTFRTLAAAKKHEQEVQYFKRH